MRLPYSTGDVVSIWFDTGSGSVPRRYRVENKGRTRQQVDIEYQQNPAGSWILTSWVRNEFGADGRLLMTTKGQVISTNLNLEYAKEQFDIRFPAGALVYNARERKDYIVQEDGVTMQEYDISTGEMRSETTYQPGTPWLRRNLTWITITGACVITMVCIALFRREKRFPDSQSSQPS